MEGLIVEFEEGVQKGEDKLLDVVRVKYIVFCFRVVNQKNTSVCYLGC
jgi:hypothetical protein